MTALVLELTSLLTFWLCLAAWHRDRTARGRRLFIAVSGCAFLWTTAALGSAHGALTPDKLRRLAYLGVLPIPALWLALAMVVRGSPLAQRAPWGLAALLAPGALCYALLLLGGDLAAWFVSEGPGEASSHGPLWWVNAGYSWALAGLASFQFLASARRLRAPRDRIRRMCVGIGTALPMLSNAAYILLGLPGMDPTPILLGAALVALRSELFAGDLLQALPLSEYGLLNQMPTPIVLTDLGGHVIEINPAAQTCLGVTKADALGRSFELLVEDAAFAPEFERWSLVASGREAGGLQLLAGKKAGSRADGSACPTGGRPR